MRWLRDEEINEFLNERDYDIRKSGSARWIDQKCTPDVLCTVADCIIEFCTSNPELEYFTSLNIWHNKYTVDFVEELYKKPNPDEEKARNEYDKYFQQPMEMLSYAGVLEKNKDGRRNIYKVSNYDLLEFISIREMNALKFIYMYNQKVLKDSGLEPYFDTFFNNPNQETYQNVKTTFYKFTTQYTPINGETECNRIFSKIINPIAFMKHSYGTEYGRVSKEVITHDMLMYNRSNFRDLYSGKPKGITRKEHSNAIDEASNKTFIRYQSAKAKKLLRKYNDLFNMGKSEVEDEYATGHAINMHHIFPENEYMEISDYIENLIALTPSQHFIEAHPDGNTQVISRDFQQICLIAKAEKIKLNILGQEDQIIYSFPKFKYVLSIGLDNENFENVEDMDFDSIIQMINIAYLKMKV